MIRRGPFREIVKSERVGSRGSTEWVTELMCGHVHTTSRMPNKPRMCCVSCVPDTVEDDTILDMSTERTRVLIASRFGVDTDQVVMFEGGCQITMDAFQVRKLQIGKT